MVSGSRRGRDIIKSLVQRPRRTFTKKQIEEHNLGIILIVMSSLFIFCQSFKIIPDMYEIFQCNRLGKYGGNCEMKGPVSISNTEYMRNPDHVYMPKMEYEWNLWIHLSYACTQQRLFLESLHAQTMAFLLWSFMYSSLSSLIHRCYRIEFESKPGTYSCIVCNPQNYYSNS